MRIVPFCILAIALAVPTAATAAPPTPDRAAQAAAALQNPLVQDAVARTLTQLAGIVLDTKVGSLATLTDPDADIRPDDTLRDVTGRDDPDLEAHLYDRTRRAVATAGAIAGGATRQAAEIDRTALRLKTALAPLLALIAKDGDAPADR